MNAVQQAETLLEYFRDLPESEINQRNGHLKREGAAVCFGAHVAFALGASQSFCEGGSWCYRDGANIMEALITSTGKDTYEAFEAEGFDEPYGVENWPKHPYEVLSNLFDKIGLVEKVSVEA